MTKNALVKKLNKEIAPFTTTNNYFETLGQSFNGIVQVLADNHIPLNDDSLTLFGFVGNEGRKNWEIQTLLGKVYLEFVWYKMSSGRWEIVAYFS